MNTPISETLISPIVLLLAALTGTVFYARSVANENRHLYSELRYYQSTYLRKHGCTSLWNGSNGNMITYDLRSFDGGHNWYAVDQVDPVLTIKGTAEEVYPGLLVSLAEWDTLLEKVAQNGPLYLTNTDDVKFLTDHGFKISTN